MKFYIATQLERADVHHQVRDALVALGHELTYDWTVHGSVGKERYTSLALTETEGVLAADVLVVLLPGGTGTHSELGIGLGAGKHVIVHTLDTEDRELLVGNGRTCLFYWHPRVHRVFGSVDEIVQVFGMLEPKENLVQGLSIDLIDAVEGQLDQLASDVQGNPKTAAPMVGRATGAILDEIEGLLEEFAARTFCSPRAGKP